MKSCIVMLNAPYSGSIARLTLEWYYIVGPVLGCIVIFAVGWYMYKRRRAGEHCFILVFCFANKVLF